MSGRGFRKGVLIAAAVLATTAVVVFGVGAALPVEHAAVGSTVLTAPPERVWRLLTEVERFPEWRPGITAVQRVPGIGDLPAWREESSTGPLTLAVEEWDPPRRLVARISDEDLPFGGKWVYEVEPEGAGSRLTITEEGEVYSPLFRFMARFVFGHDATIRDYLAAAEAEIGVP
jgi:uncharacterized protein YndB with AHSA1/START domain